MIENFLEKLSQPKTSLIVSDLTPDEKQRIYALFVSYGSSQGFAYDRLFKEGFVQWELEGIDNIKRQFLKDHDKDLNDYQRVCALVAEEPGRFYSLIGESIGLKTALKEVMQEKGMNPVTCQQRFAADNFKQYERVGIMAILKEFSECEGKRS